MASQVKTALNNIYRILSPNTEEYTLFSAAHGTFSKIDHMLGNRKYLNKYGETEMILYILPDKNKMTIHKQHEKL